MNKIKSSLRWFVIAGLAVAIALVVLVAPHASSNPDGLEKVAADKRIDLDQRDSPVAGGPLADYAVEGGDDGWRDTAVSGVIGVVATFGLGAGVLALVRRRS